MGTDLFRLDPRAWSLGGIHWTIIAFATIFMYTELGASQGKIAYYVKVLEISVNIPLDAVAFLVLDFHTDL